MGSIILESVRLSSEAHVQAAIIEADGTNITICILTVGLPLAVAVCVWIFSR